MPTVRVHLAEVPTDVLVWLAQQDPDATFGLTAITHQVRPPEVPPGTARSCVAIALRLLLEAGYVERDLARELLPVWRATDAGREAVAEARSS